MLFSECEGDRRRGTHNHLGGILVGLNGLGDVKDVGLVEEHDGREYSNKWL